LFAVAGSGIPEDYIFSAVNFAIFPDLRGLLFLRSIVAEDPAAFQDQVRFPEEIR
jgi:hypothetical protein